MLNPSHSAYPTHKKEISSDLVHKMLATQGTLALRRLCVCVCVCVCVQLTYREIAGIMALPAVCDETAHRKAGGAKRFVALQNRVAPCDGHVINHPLVHVALVNAVLQELEFCPVCFVLCVRLRTENSIGHVLCKRNLKEEIVHQPTLTHHTQLHSLTTHSCTHHTQLRSLTIYGDALILSPNTTCRMDTTDYLHSSPYPPCPLPPLSHGLFPFL